MTSISVTKPHRPRRPPRGLGTITDTQHYWNFVNTCPIIAQTFLWSETKNVKKNIVGPIVGPNNGPYIRWPGWSPSAWKPISGWTDVLTPERTDSNPAREKVGGDKQ
jgi:hypothetical protein